MVGRSGLEKRAPAPYPEDVPPAGAPNGGPSARKSVKKRAGAQTSANIYEKIENKYSKTRKTKETIAKTHQNAR